jgi:hypothetical protein
MRFPAISGTIDRRILINFRVDQDVVARYLPRPFRPKLFAGMAVVGICLIRLKHIRPKGFPRSMGISSENGAHRIAVEWEGPDALKEGVFVPRRDTSSRMNALAGGTVFPGTHHRARFTVNEGNGAYAVAFRSADGTTLKIDAKEVDDWNSSSIFPDLLSASEFMRAGSDGYSPASNTEFYDGLELRTFNWAVSPLEVSYVESSFFEDRRIIPDGSVHFDNALLMKSIEHEWHGIRSIKVK